MTYPAEGAYRNSVFILREKVEGQGNSARVRVMVTTKDGKTFAALPTQRRDIVMVAAADLTE